MSARLITVNGIYSNGKNSVDRIGDPLRDMGVDVIDLCLPLSTVLTAGLEKATGRKAKIVQDAAEFGDHVLAHSFGCEVVQALVVPLCVVVVDKLPDAIG